MGRDRSSGAEIGPGLSTGGLSAHPRSAILVVALLGLCGSGVRAQESPDSGTTVRARLLRELAEGTPLRLREAGLPGWLEGSLTGVDASVVSLAVGDEAVTVALGGLEEIQAWKNRARQGTVVGGAVGLGTGLVVGWLLVGVGEVETWAGAVEVLGFSGLVGTVAGAAIGRLLGATTSGWERIYP